MSEIVKLLAAIGRYWISVVLCGVLGAAGAAGIGALRSPEYEATATVSVVSTVQGINPEQSTRDAMERVTTYAQLVAGSDVLQNAAEELPGVSLGDLRKSVIGRARPDTVLIDISARDESSSLAVEKANAVAVALADMVGGVEDRTQNQGSHVDLVLVGSPENNVATTGLSTVQMIVIGALLGLVVGVFVALVMAQRDRRIRGVGDIQDAVMAPCLGSLIEDPDSEKGLPHQGVNGERFRKIRGTLTVSPRNKLILFTNSTSEEGVTYVSTGLACVLAESGAKTLLVDTNMRTTSVRPLADYWNISAHDGVSTVLAGSSTLEAAVHQVSEHLHVLPAGKTPENPGKLLAAHVEERLTGPAREAYDYVIFDTAGMADYADALVIAPLVDSLVLVAKLGTTRFDQLRHAEDLLESISINVAGVFANFVPPGKDVPIRNAQGVRYNETREEQGWETQR